ncbi:MAG: glutathione S-transferase family protein [Candidatus Thiodiazotropha sp. (ex Myrtea spinifera)]|nr:glutathione S-transferase family protein [Candidatus Thiodiazotropha sp. (ex Myrtea spinifera)]MCU7830243.1 glutathione S-transferase family protein [Candidatus Thiodiazotropha sp. (ex Myrtea sp. 'scaly one' KF741663)]
MSIKLVSFVLCPFVQRAVIILREKGVPHDIEYIELDDPPEWFRQLSPLGKVPLLLVDEGVLFESSVILDYLDEVNPPRLHPGDPLRRAQHKSWIEFGSGLLMLQHGIAMAENESLFYEKLGELNKNLERLLPPLRQSLFGDKEHFSLVDMAYAPFFMRQSILATRRPEITSSQSAEILDWAHTLLARPCVESSVVPDFSTRYMAFLQGKGSWLAGKTG